MRIKICCIQSVDEADMAVRAGADLIGLVAAMPSGPGPIDDAEIAKITRWTPPGVTSVLLSSETSAAGLIAHVRACRPSALQIVDAPSFGARMAVREAFPALKIIQVIHVEDRRALRDAEHGSDGERGCASQKRLCQHVALLA